MRRIYYVWAAGLFLKLAGATWDIAWHFESLRESISPPHLINVVGNLICAGALVYEWRNLQPHRRTAFLIALGGAGVFALAIPVDEAWHRIFGLDITTWSPAHLMLFAGTAIAVTGIALMLLADLRHAGRSALTATPAERAMLAFVLLVLVESVAFPLGYNEYTTIAVQTAMTDPGSMDPQLVELARTTPDPVFRGTPHWLYPIYAIAFVAFLGTIIRASLGSGWALVVLTGLAIERVVANGILVATGWPGAVLPLQYIGMGLIIEAAWMVPVRKSTRALVGGAAVALGGYVYFVSPLPWLPSIPLDASSWPVGVPLAAGLAWLGYHVQERAPALMTRVDEVEWVRVSNWARETWNDWRS